MVGIRDTDLVLPQGPPEGDRAPGPTNDVVTTTTAAENTSTPEISVAEVGAGSEETRNVTAGTRDRAATQRHLLPSTYRRR